MPDSSPGQAMYKTDMNHWHSRQLGIYQDCRDHNKREQSEEVSLAKNWVI